MNIAVVTSGGGATASRREVIERALAAAVSVPEVAARLPEAKPELAVRLSGDRELRGLNRKFLGLDETTDVLSFPAGDALPAVDVDRGYLGDVVISWPAVERQAQEFGHSADVELALLSVHGLLHLLGWDHVLPDEEREMSRLTRAALASAGFALADSRLADSIP